jgi:hypothetical protein
LSQKTFYDGSGDENKNITEGASLNTLCDVPIKE